MNTGKVLLLLIALALSTVYRVEAETVYKHQVTSITGEPVSMERYRDKVLLIVNTASKCGFTYQLGELQELREKYRDENFEVLGFPSNDFGGQEPKSNQEIQHFCSATYDVAFPLFEKGPVRGDAKQPLYRFLTESGPKETRGEVRWNFEKFLIGRDGRVAARFSSREGPLSKSVIQAVDHELSGVGNERS